jgi:hypothetical protein
MLTADILQTRLSDVRRDSASGRPRRHAPIATTRHSSRSQAGNCLTSVFLRPARPCRNCRSSDSAVAPARRLGVLRDFSLHMAVLVVVNQRAQGWLATVKRRGTGTPDRHPIGALTHFRCSSRLRRGEKSSPEQVEFGATVHLPFDEFEPGDLAFGLPVGPGLGHRRGDRLLIGDDAFAERRNRLQKGS